MRGAASWILAAATMWVAVSGVADSAPAADSTSSVARASAVAIDLSAQSRRGTRLRVYRPSRRLPANAVRPCVTQLVQEYRPSGQVIVPRTVCWWQRG